jgi:CRISPR-associated protein Cas2
LLFQNDRNRNALARTLKDFGERVQKSVFEAEINETELVRLRKQLSWVKLDNDDSIRLYRLCEGCVKTVQIWGSGEVTKDPDIVVL